MINTNFNNAQEAFECLYDDVMNNGVKFDNTIALFNQGFYIKNPLDNKITTSWRKWSENYAEYEWQWYLSGNPSAIEIAKKAMIWNNMMDEKGNVNSNYGYQWNRNNQLNKVIDLLKSNPNTRKASISLYDGKEIDLYTKDTVCTYAIDFDIASDKLNMSVMMRSNDLVFGFCNDQYCFSKLQELVANKLNKSVGTYYHFVKNLHIYERHFNLKPKL